MIKPKVTKKASTVLYDPIVATYLEQERKRTGYSKSDLVNIIIKAHMGQEKQQNITTEK